MHQFNSLRSRLLAENHQSHLCLYLHKYMMPPSQGHVLLCIVPLGAFHSYSVSYVVCGFLHLGTFMFVSIYIEHTYVPIHVDPCHVQ